MNRSEEEQDLVPDPFEVSLPSLINICQQLEKLGQTRKSIEVLRVWLTKNPNNEDSFAGWYEFGRLLQSEKLYVQSENAFRAALELRPLFFQARVALGKALELQGKKAEAIDCWQSSLPANSIQIELLNNVARLQEDRQDLPQLEATLLKSLAIDSNQDAVITTLLQVRQKLCKWPVVSPALPVSLARQNECVGPLMSLALYDDPRMSLRTAETFLASKGIPSGRTSDFDFSYQRGEKLHIGFLSADFRLHATSVFFAPLIHGVDKNLFSVSLLDLTVAADSFPEFRQGLINSADQYIPLQHLSDDEAVALCRKLKLDILIDLAGLTAGARPQIVARRVAPLQISYIGFLSSTGIGNLDYIITTPDLFPEDTASFTERPLYLDTPYLVLDREVDTAKLLTKDRFNIPEGAFVFGALLNTYKINNEVFEAWMQILKGSKESILWLLEDSVVARDNLIRQADAMGVSSSRLLFSKRVHPALYRNQLGLCDIFLDAFPYGSGATARDALLANLPIITKPGNTMMSRLSSHMMKSAGITELTCISSGDYVDKAIFLAKNKDVVVQLKRRLLDDNPTSPIFDANKFVAGFYRKISSVAIRDL